MIIFHEVASDSVEAVLQNGLAQGSRGEKTDKDIARTDEFLDAHRPKKSVKKGLCRVRNTYGYLPRGEKIINITTGKDEPLSFFLKKPCVTLLQIDVDPHNCYVSDLDLFDEIMKYVIKGDVTRAKSLASTYWRKVRKLSEYADEFRRPEVIITYSIPPNLIHKVASV